MLNLGALQRRPDGPESNNLAEKLRGETDGAFCSIATLVCDGGPVEYFAIVRNALSPRGRTSSGEKKNNKMGGLLTPHLTREHRHLFFTLAFFLTRAKAERRVPLLLWQRRHWSAERVAKFPVERHR